MNSAKILKKKIFEALEGLTFDDVLLLPGFSDFKRDQVDLKTKLHKDIILKIPVISSPMDTVTEEKMARAMAENGGLGIIHRNLSVLDQRNMVLKVKSTLVKDKNRAALDKKNRLLVGAAVGLGRDFEERVKALAEAEVDLLVIDSGHGMTQFMAEGVSFIKKNFPRMVLMAGNIATAEGARYLVRLGVDILRVGMGPGSICTTRVVTGMGVPQLTAIAQAVFGAKGKAAIVADGGIKQFGDIAKALAFGAQAVMLGSLLAGCDESPGLITEIDGKKYKVYRGMGSVTSMKKGGAERYGQEVKKSGSALIAEGVEGLVKYKGKLSDFLFQLTGSLRSSFYYIGAKDIDEFFLKSRFIKITPASLIESHPHSLKVIDPGRNYNF